MCPSLPQFGMGIVLHSIGGLVPRVVLLKKVVGIQEMAAFEKPLGY